MSGSLWRKARHQNACTTLTSQAIGNKPGWRIPPFSQGGEPSTVELAHNHSMVRPTGIVSKIRDWIAIDVIFAHGQRLSRLLSP
nr:hypothetical protein [Sphingomonas sp.]